MTTYLITGVSGALGSRVISRFPSRLDGDLIGVDRRPLRVSAPTLQYKTHDLAVSDLNPVFENVDVVIHLANTGGAEVLRRVLDASANAKVKSVISLSSAAVLGAWRTNPVPMTEQSLVRPTPGFPFATDLAEQERLLQDWKRDHPDVAVCVLRLAMILGGGLERALADALGGMEAYRRMDSSRPVQFLHIDDAVDAILLAAEKRLDGLYNVAPHGFVGDAQARAITGVVPRPSLPRRLAWVANKAVWHVRHGADFVAAHPYLEHPWVLSNDAICAEGWSPRYSSEEALVANAPSGILVRFGTRERRRAVASAVLGSGALSVTGVVVGVGALIRYYRRR
jgi:nucleoside-diphosphate-sugar epimerase